MFLQGVQFMSQQAVQFVTKGCLGEFISLQGVTLYYSVSDPDPDPVGSGLFGSPGSGSGSFIHKKTLVIIIFSLYKIVKITVSSK